jgi:hypothetical protein
MSTPTLTVVVSTSIDEPRLIRHCDELKNLLEESNLDPVIFIVAAQITNKIFELYLRQEGAVVSELLKQKVAHVNHLATTKGFPSILRTL